MPEYAPLDYSSAFSNVPQPGAAFTQGVESGVGIQNLQLGQAMKQYQFQRMQSMQQAASDVAQNPTPEKISQLSIAFPEMSEQFKRSYDMLQPQEQRADLQHMTEVHAAMQNGQPEIAAKLLNDRATALENSGAPPLKIQAAKAAAQWATLHPDTFTAASGVMLASIMGPEKFGDTFSNLTTGEKTQATTPAAVQQATADASKATTDAALEGARVTADINKTNAETGKTVTMLGLPPPEAQSRINTAQAGAAESQASAQRYFDLANRMEDADRTTGASGNAYEAAKRAFGVGDGQTALKQEYSRIVSSGALSTIKNALGGRVTDTDMNVAMGPVPDANASTQTVTSYLRGAAKIQLADSVLKQSESEWLSQVGAAGHTGPAPHDLTIMGTQVPKGTTLSDFTRQFLPQKIEQISAQSTLSRAQGRSYLQYATPNAGGAAAPRAAAPDAQPGAPAPVAQPAAAATSAQPQSEMDQIATKLDALNQQRATLKDQVDETRRDIMMATSQSKKQYFTPDMVSAMQAKHATLAAQLGAIDAQITGLNAQGRSASMQAPGTAPKAIQQVIDKYRPVN